MIAIFTIGECKDLAALAAAGANHVADDFFLIPGSHVGKHVGCAHSRRSVSDSTSPKHYYSVRSGSSTYRGRRSSTQLQGTMALLAVCCALLSLQVSLCSATLDVFQVYQPVSTGNGGITGCYEDVLLMQHTFSSSYGKPFIGTLEREREREEVSMLTCYPSGNYTPPKCDFDTVRMNLTVTSKGRQFDRLGLMYLGDSEVFRTSTAEPTADGIVWSYIKDMTAYNALWKEPQKLIFDLGNTVTDVYTGSFNMTLTATFSRQGNTSRTADVVMPISAQKSGSDSPSAFTIPSDDARVSHRLPASASRAVVAVSACGQAAEEFWWSNVFSSDTLAFSDTAGELDGYSSFREIQLYIDNALAGVVWPFPVVFTGGVSPGFWRPIVGIDAFDLRQPEIDISPFLPVLTDQHDHSFELKVVGLDLLRNGSAVPSASIGSNWVVSGGIFVYLDDEHDDTSSSSSNKVSPPHITAPAPKISVSRDLIKNPVGNNETLSYSVHVQRNLTITSSDYSWTQNLSFSNRALLTRQGLSQTTNQTTSGTNVITQIDTNSHSDSTDFEYPLYFNTLYSTVGDTDAQMDRGLSIEATGGPGVSTYTFNTGPVSLHTRQWGDAHYQAGDNGSSLSFGDTSQVFAGEAAGVSYHRSVRATNGSVVYDGD